MASTCPDTSALYTGGQMAGLALGLSLPLLLALATALLLLRKEKQRHSPRKPKLMYKLPDNHAEDAHLRPPLHRAGTDYSSNGSSPVTYPSSALGSQRQSLKGTGHVKGFLDRYGGGGGGKKGGYDDLELQARIVELEGAPPYQEVQRFELGESHRKSR